MLHSEDKIQISTRAFSAVTLAGSAGWVDAVYISQRKWNAHLFIYLFCICQTQIYPMMKQKAP